MKLGIIKKISAKEIPNKEFSNKCKIYEENSQMVIFQKRNFQKRSFKKENFKTQIYKKQVPNQTLQTILLISSVLAQYGTCTPIFISFNIQWQALEDVFILLIVKNDKVYEL